MITIRFSITTYDCVDLPINVVYVASIEYKLPNIVLVSELQGKRMLWFSDVQGLYLRRWERGAAGRQVSVYLLTCPGLFVLEPVAFFSSLPQRRRTFHCPKPDSACCNEYGHMERSRFNASEEKTENQQSNLHDSTERSDNRGPIVEQGIKESRDIL